MHCLLTAYDNYLKKHIQVTLWMLVLLYEGFECCSTRSCTHRGGDEDKQGVSIDTHRLQEGVRTGLALCPLPPGQETPDAQRHKPCIEEHHKRCYRHWKHTKMSKNVSFSSFYRNEIWSLEKLRALMSDFLKPHNSKLKWSTWKTRYRFQRLKNLKNLICLTWKARFTGYLQSSLCNLRWSPATQPEALTFVELGPVVVLPITLVAQEVRKVPTDGHREHQCCTDPEGTYSGWA